MVSLIQAKMTWIQGLPPPHETKTWDLREAIIWLHKLGIHQSVDWTLY